MSTALGRFGRPEEVAAGVVFLASPYASYHCEVFRAFTERAALSIHQRPYHAGLLESATAFDCIEGVYLDAIKPCLLATRRSTALASSLLWSSMPLLPIPPLTCPPQLLHTGRPVALARGIP